MSSGTTSLHVCPCCCFFLFFFFLHAYPGHQTRLMRNVCWLMMTDMAPTRLPSLSSLPVSCDAECPQKCDSLITAQPIWIMALSILRFLFLLCFACFISKQQACIILWMMGFVSWIFDGVSYFVLLRQVCEVCCCFVSYVKQWQPCKWKYDCFVLRITRFIYVFLIWCFFGRGRDLFGLLLELPPVVLKTLTGVQLQEQGKFCILFVSVCPSS